ncbi:valine--tRNA ligase [Chitinivibrio alkaliphilus]|uniref:Valine--tRNA ligase n=1 Tax=Chitinivibrio alkaliphilus ACht1 TaxID=1313304 RepID=U7D987_9BACT|nr:valine--tRNA ligase [Chitinivibrio alkaliphilus]ERP30965.1 valyl-tRNA synthetase [Chitinivibrio alkaliphilus ACht1]
MEKQYNPAAVEDKIYAKWQSENTFAAQENTSRETYSIVIPPPNVTGILHMGHALNNTIQDILTRYKRMDGFEALWLPGTDHAGIATQNVVERKLAQRGESRHSLGRERFLEEVWRWKDEYHTTITTQLKRLGSSCDWDKERFTMDEGLSQAVRKVFVDLYREGLVYRGKYIVNWCPRCHTALADDEVEHHTKASHLWHFCYPLSDGTGHVEVATTRPETMLGDTAVAVNPKDSRYGHLIGKTLRLPIVDREIPIVGDNFVSSEFGTGCVKVTPAHDPNDYQMGQTHNLEYIVILDETGCVTGPVPEKYKGVDRFDARKMVLADLEDLGLMGSIVDHDHSVGHCYRCDTIIEPYYSDQWFVKMKPLAQDALKAAQDGSLTFYPKRWKKTYVNWMEDIRDWCISRQIWWGHRIPVWYCQECGEIIVEMEDPTQCSACSSHNITQDEDVLDTWFSSWLWPFSTMGWPNDTALLQSFFPTDTLVTAPEILFFWVARMVMSSLHFTGKLPFSHVVLHGTVRDKSGKKMSKSLGNSIDPLEIIEKYGTDALRFSLITITAQGADVYLGKDTFDLGRNFANKLWNASRFLLGNLSEPLQFSELPEPTQQKEEDRWILHRYATTVEAVRHALETFRFNEACHLLYDFIWRDYCDWYVEAKKSSFYAPQNEEERRNAYNVASYVLAGALKLLHPVMPFITEEIWMHMRKKITHTAIMNGDTLMLEEYPQIEKNLYQEELGDKFDLLKEMIAALRTIRSENNVPPAKKGSALIIASSPELAEWFSALSYLFTDLANLSDITIDTTASEPDFAGQEVVKGQRLYLHLAGLIDKSVEMDRLQKEISRLEKVLGGLEKKLSNEAFLAKAPGAVVAKEQEKRAGVADTLEKLRTSFEKMK